MTTPQQWDILIGPTAVDADGDKIGKASPGTGGTGEDSYAGRRDAALSGADISEEEHEVILQAERPVVAKETVPVERVHLATETVTEERQIDEEVRKEQIDEPEVNTSDVLKEHPHA
jgi:stress response protein YsnF